MEVLTNKQYKKYPKLSRYMPFPIYFNTVDNKWITATTTHLVKDIPYDNYKVKGKESYDVIALNYYNNPTLYWVICDFNDIQNPFEKPERGTLLKIPVLSAVKFDV